MRVLRGHEDDVFDVASSPCGNILASAGYDGWVLLWAATTAERIAEWTAEPWPMLLAFTPDGSRLATSSLDGTVKIWRVPDAAAVE